MWFESMEKKILLAVMVIIMIMTNVYGNLYIDSNDISRMNTIRFLELKWEKSFEKPITGLTVRYGNTQNSLVYNGKLTKRSGKEIKFSNIQDALNHIRKDGWKDVRNFIKCSSGKSISHFVFRKGN